jgi:hypothetical protein
MQYTISILSCVDGISLGLFTRNYVQYPECVRIICESGVLSTNLLENKHPNLSSISE